MIRTDGNQVAGEGCAQTGQPESTGKNVQRTVQSAEVSAKGRLRETSADSTVRCTSPRLHSTGEEPNSRKAAPEADEYWLNSLSPISYPWIWALVGSAWNPSAAD